MATIFKVKRRPKPTPAESRLLLCQGNALQLPLLENSVHCVVTSPPYYGLRDYGTGTWSGGNPVCTHSPSDTPMRRGLATSTLVGGKANTGHQQEGYKKLCPRCGATRNDHQLGLESTPEQYVRVMAQVFREVRRVLRSDGVLFLNIGDSYVANRGNTTQHPGYDNKAANGGANLAIARRPYLDPRRLPEKNLIGIPWRVALALQRSGWVLRSEIIWEKTNVMPESVKDRPTKAHEQVFMFTKRGRYFYDAVAIREPAKDWGTRDRSTSKHHTNGYRDAGQTPHGGLTNGNQATTGRNARSVWSFATQSFSGAHFATFPEELVRRCLLAGVPHHVCTTCGAPWVREVQRTFRPMTDRSPEKLAMDSGPKGHYGNWGNLPRGYIDTKTSGFAPTCMCLGGVGQATVLDPFCGSGTTLQVARELGHAAIGVDLSWDYLHTIARKRLGAVPNL